MNGYKFITASLLLLFCIMVSISMVMADRGHKRGQSYKKQHGKRHDYGRGYNRRYRNRGRNTFRFHAPGHRIARLPRRIHRISHGRNQYFYRSGVFYRPYGSGYVVIRAPIGVNIYSLPPGYRRFNIGSRYYFYANSGYYAWVAATRQYVVIDRPDGADAALAAPYDDGATVPQGSSEQYCHEQAMEDSGYYPGLPDDQGKLRKMYEQAMAACLGGG
ncbi:MAG TPA: hypothetical protein ENG78_06780 [Acidiferrobacteraceae bacterium]|nr:hypothetical protein [Acidiferrobacteraceae bacterium]HEX20504.1 hypothetical protein [Acidiferrobacteraceae bacterium]